MVRSLILASALFLSSALASDHAQMEEWPQFGSSSFGARPLNPFSASKGPFFRPGAPPQIDRRALGRSEDSGMDQQGFMSRIDFDGLLKDVQYGQPDKIEARDGGHHSVHHRPPVHHSAPLHHGGPVHHSPPAHHSVPVHHSGPSVHPVVHASAQHSGGDHGGFIEGQGFQVPSKLIGNLEGFEFGGPFGTSSESFASFLQGQGASAGFPSAPHKRQIQPTSYQPPAPPSYGRPSYERSGYEEPKQDSYFDRADTQFKRETPKFSFDGSEFGPKESEFGSPERFVRPEPVYRPQEPKVTPVSQYQPPTFRQKEDRQDPFANFQFERSEKPERPTPVFSQPPATPPPTYTPPVYTTQPTTPPQKSEYPKPDYKPHAIQKKPVHPPHKYEKKNFRQPVQAKPSSAGDHKLIRVQTTDERFSQKHQEHNKENQQQFLQDRFGPQPSESFQRSESFKPVSHQDRFQPLGGSPGSVGPVEYDNSQAIVTAPPKYLKPAKGQIYNVEVGASFGTNPVQRRNSGPPVVTRQSRSFENAGFYEGPLEFRPQGFKDAFVVDF